MGALFGIIFYLVIAAGIASKFADIAALKGHARKEYFWQCFLFGPAGWVMVAALPDRSSAQTPVISDELPDL